MRFTLAVTKVATKAGVTGSYGITFKGDADDGWEDEVRNMLNAMVEGLHTHGFTTDAVMYTTTTERLR